MYLIWAILAGNFKLYPAGILDVENYFTVINAYSLPQH